MIRNFKTSIVARPSKKSESHCILYIRVLVDGQTAEFSTRQSIEKSQWNSSAQRAIGRSHSSEMINQLIDENISAIHQHANELIIKKIPFNLTNLKKSLTGDLDEKKTILEAFHYHNDRAAKLGTERYVPATVQKYRRLAKTMEMFLIQSGYGIDYQLSQITLGFINQFDDYLRINLKYGNNTATKSIHSFKTVFNLAKQLDWVSHNPFSGYTGRIKNLERKRLSKQDLQLIEKTDFGMDRLNRVKDVFLFACYTGLSFSDLKKLSQKDIIRDANDQSWIHQKRTKTEIATTVPLMPKALAIIEKYSDDIYCLSQNVLLPVLSNQKYNSYLKEISSVCYIPFELTSHIARHTFATTIALDNGVSMEAVSRMLGHSDTKMTQHYARVTTQKLTNEIAHLQKAFK